MKKDFRLDPIYLFTGRQTMNKIGEGNYNTVYYEDELDQVRKIPKFDSALNNPKRAANIAKEIYPNLNITYDEKSWCMPYMEGLVSLEDDKEMAEEILKIYRKTRRIALDGCRTANFRRDNNGTLYLIDYDVCVRRRNSAVSIKFWQHPDIEIANEKYWSEFEKNKCCLYSVGIIRKLIWLEKCLKDEEIKNEYLQFKWVWGIDTDQKLDKNFFSALMGQNELNTRRRALRAAEEYIRMNKDNPATEHGRNHTEMFIRNLQAKRDPGEEEVKLEVSKWLKGYSLFGRKSNDRMYSRGYYASEFKLI
jgi:hypothetical protein